MVLQYQGQEIDLSKPFHRLTPLAAIKKFAPNYTDEELNNPGSSSAPSLSASAVRSRLTPAWALCRWRFLKKPLKLS